MPNTITTGETVIQPVTFRLPRPRRPKRKDGKIIGWLPAENDPHFGFSRSYYYGLEGRGTIKLIHLRGDDKSRGITLVPFAEVAEFVRLQMEKRSHGIEGTLRDHASENRRESEHHA